jgi:hypothetical protein
MSSSSFQKLFNRRPATATVGLSIAAISFLATILTGLVTVLSGANRFFFDFVVGAQFGDSSLTFRQAIVGIAWSAIGLIACYLALEPRNLARFTVIVTAGVKLIALTAFTQQAGRLPLWQYLLIISLAVAPIILLLLRPSNQYYGRNQ